ncbi:30S ribosomal protein S20 [Minwuia thermotolerans]|jgi:small subunit ribosomal protein S20|uniref:Small ribosomal subunit protein bS20 n=1 Tax=Minwuia thermotolerans TaxID=2056226 RepID=A0A2M9G5G3_9PROT|nr:30S ribosomal protein S20 [Minwuia thermotolerans]ANK80264.1 MAG: 30S ribosomal protein S20 [Rhizobiales bacterium NRL2]PJK30958.1 30S ribosomal protein S20 [Minwuia thermotolerans]
MANIKSSEKDIRRTATRTARNVARRSRMRTYVKRVEVALAAGDAEAANKALQIAQSELDKAAQKGVIKRNAAARKVSRLNARTRALASA